ncbi:MAG: FmdB family zinc ribbon protein [Actinomycetota bacterium]
MPTYDYRCNETGEMFEIWQSFSEDALTECPTCDGTLTKVYSKVGIAFKGDGFYKNDHGAASKGSSPESAGTDSSSSSSSSDSPSPASSSD